MAQRKPVQTRQRRTKKTYEREIAQLLAKGKKNSKVDQREIFALIPDTPANIDVLDSVYNELAESDIEVIPLEAPEPESLSEEWVAEAPVEAEVLKADTSYLDDVSDDSVRLYLREIGK